MTKAYQETLARMYALAPRGIRLELDRMRKALRMRGNPERELRAVHVAGTNGKGSVSATVASILQASGFNVGLYTSPHLQRFVERIRVNGRPISEASLVTRYRDLDRTLSKPNAPELTFFEVATLLAFEHFRDARCDLVVLEVGLGGRLDATNVLTRPLASVITNIAMDHEAYLGSTLAEIAREKAGILRTGAPLIAGVRDPSAHAAIAEIAKQKRVRAHWIDQNFAAMEGEAGITVRVGDHVFRNLSSSLDGAHQRDNLACAIATCVALEDEGLVIPESAMRRGIRRVRWPGRLERIAGRPEILIDAAHNPDGCRALAFHLSSGPTRRRVLVFGAMRDKAHEAMLHPLLPLFDTVIFTRPETPRAADPSELASRFGGTAMPEVRTALDAAKRRAGPAGLVVCAGSIYLLAEARAALLGVRTDPIVTM